jgi:hypothetical protein
MGSVTFMNHTLSFMQLLLRIWCAVWPSVSKFIYIYYGHRVTNKPNKEHHLWIGKDTAGSGKKALRLIDTVRYKTPLSHFNYPCLTCENMLNRSFFCYHFFSILIWACLLWWLELHVFWLITFVKIWVTVIATSDFSIQLCQKNILLPDKSSVLLQCQTCNALIHMTLHDSLLTHASTSAHCLDFYFWPKKLYFCQTLV